MSYSVIDGMVIGLKETCVYYKGWLLSINSVCQEILRSVVFVSWLVVWFVHSLLSGQWLHWLAGGGRVCVWQACRRMINITMALQVPGGRLHCTSALS